MEKRGKVVKSDLLYIYEENSRYYLSIYNSVAGSYILMKVFITKDEVRKFADQFRLDVDRELDSLRGY